jgi:gamma-glutamylcyclotransferase (GGCT)/AIG2-like uncharacterized protein YtfP
MIGVAAVSQPPTTLFVYGTLRSDSGHELSGLLARHALRRSAARVRGRLFDLGSYPGMVPDAGSGFVTGELYVVKPEEWDALISVLDRYEGCGPDDPEPHEYRRVIVEVRTEDGTVASWAYVLNRPVP